MTFVLPQNSVAPVNHVEVRFDPTPHPFELANAEAIEANWQAEHAANPALFDGRVVLLSQLALDGDRLTGVCHPVRYATMLYWRKNKGNQGIWHSFAFAVLVASDNALVAIRMGPQTANAGRVYFAAGSFEPSDVVDGLVDLTGNMHREVLEETGLQIAGLQTDSSYHITSANFSTLIFRRYWLEEDADTIARRIEAFVATEVEPEVVGPVIIRNDSDLPDNLSDHMKVLIAWHFGEGSTARN